jgi:hypothetical protein
MDLESEYIHLVSCPTDWKEETTQDWGPSVLQFDWHHVLLNNAVRREDVAFEPETDLLWRGDPNLGIIVHDLKLRRKQAKEMYKERAGRLAGIEFLTPSEHGKHFVPNLSEAKILERTRNGPSLFFKNHSSAELKAAFWQWFFWFFGTIVGYEEYEEMITPGTDLYRSCRGRHWDKFIHNHELRICLENAKPLGGCEGEQSAFVCFDIHIDSRQGHCYPVAHSEALRIMGGDGVEVIQALSC